jgi:hypothetical protein
VAVLHPQFVDKLPVPRESTEKYYQNLTFPIYCFKIDNVFHSPLVASDSIRNWRLTVSDITSHFSQKVFCTFLAQIIMSLIIIILIFWAFSGYHIKNIRWYSCAKNFRKIFLSYQNFEKQNGIRNPPLNLPSLSCWLQFLPTH